MKKSIFFLLFTVVRTFAQSPAKLDTFSTICGLKLDDAVYSDRYKWSLPERCDSCKTFNYKENLVFLKSKSVTCYGIKFVPYVRQFDNGIYQIVLPINTGGDSVLASTFIKLYGKPQRTDTVVSGAKYKRLYWISPKRRLEILNDNSSGILALTSVSVQNEFIAEYVEREQFNKRDNEAKLKLSTVPKNGNGKNTFTYSLVYLESLIKSCNTSSLTNVLGEWNLSSDPFQTQVSWSFNEKTNRRDIPTFKLHYVATVKDKPYKFWLKVPNTVSEFAYALEVSAEMNGADYAILKQSLRNGGYLLNESLTLSLGKETWENKTKQYTVSLSYRNGNIYIEILNNLRYAKAFYKK